MCRKILLPCVEFNIFSINRLQDFFGDICFKIKGSGKNISKTGEDGGFDNILSIYFVFVVFDYLALQKKPGKNYFWT